MEGQQGGRSPLLLRNGVRELVVLALLLLALQRTAATPKIALSTGDVGTFIQFGDVHYDQDYSVDGSLPLYCRGVVPPNQRNGCQPFGTPLSGADSPRSILGEVAKQLGGLTSELKPDFILWSGDTGRHEAISPQGTSFLFNSHIYSEVHLATSLLRHATNDYPWVIPLLGNNDCYGNCVGSQENRHINGNFSQLWSSYLRHVDTGRTFSNDGYMYSKVNEHLIILSLNTMLWTERNCALTDLTACGHPDSPGSVQFEWMARVASDPSHAHMSFILHGHIPPVAPPLNGDKVYFPSCLQKYYNFTATYKDRIKGHLYADQHIDVFYLMPDKLGTILVNPAVVPLFNTGIRVFSYDRRTGDLLNYWQHYINITKANEENVVTLELEYSPLSPFTSPPERGSVTAIGDPPGYGLKNMSLASWEWLNEMIVTNDSVKRLFEQYYFVSYPVGTMAEANVERWRRSRRRACSCQPWLP